MFEVGRCLYGSNNYNLAGPNSDKDYKVFMCPRFHDLYYKHSADKADIPDISHRGDDLTPMDVRRLNELVLAGNVNVTEYLFSIELHWAGPLFEEYWMAARKLYEDGYLVLVWNQWFASLEGLVKNSLDRYGVNRKSMSRAYYFYILSLKLVENDFCMNESNWRGNEWNDKVFQMRYDEHSWLPTREELETSLDYVKEVGNQSANKILKDKQIHCERLLSDARDLKMKMFNFVREVSYNDRGDC